METGVMESDKTDGFADFMRYAKEQFCVNTADIRTYSPLTLAYIGDCFYDLLIKSLIVWQGNSRPNTLHKRTAHYVKAETQAGMAEAVLSGLSEEEQAVYRRGRNAKPGTKAKNTTMETYLKATGFEALLGYLYLQGREKRAVDIVKEALTALGESI